MFDTFMSGYETALHYLAEFTAHTLEFIGILIVIVGSIRVIIKVISDLKKHVSTNIVASLGHTLAIALEFKMGAEIVNTVIIRDLEELLILGIVIALRAVLAFLIYWEIKNEEKEEKKDTPKTEEK